MLRARAAWDSVASRPLSDRINGAVSFRGLSFRCRVYSDRVGSRSRRRSHSRRRTFRDGPPLWFATVGGLALVLATALYVHRLKSSHRRLLADLENQLAERNRIEDALRASEGFHHSLVESLPQSILRKDLNGRFTFGNQKFCNSLGALAGTNPGQDRLRLLPSEPGREVPRRRSARDRHRARLRDDRGARHAAGGDAVRPRDQDAPPRRGRDDHRRSGDLLGRHRAEARPRSNSSPRTSGSRRWPARSTRRISTLKQAQSRMVQSEKLASLGQMVAGVAHEINNPVAFVSNNVAVLERDVGEMRDLIALYEEADDPDRTRAPRARLQDRGVPRTGRHGVHPREHQGAARPLARRPEADPADRRPSPPLRPARRGRRSTRPTSTAGSSRPSTIIRNLARKKQVQLDHGPGPLAAGHLLRRQDQPGDDEPADQRHRRLLRRGER